MTPFWIWMLVRFISVHRIHTVCPCICVSVLLVFHLQCEFKCLYLVYTERKIHCVHRFTQPNWYILSAFVVGMPVWVWVCICVCGVVVASTVFVCMGVERFWNISIDQTPTHPYTWLEIVLSLWTPIEWRFHRTQHAHGSIAAAAALVYCQFKQTPYQYKRDTVRFITSMMIHADTGHGFVMLPFSGYDILTCIDREYVFDCI